MKVIVNGKEKELPKGATLADALKGERYEPDSLVSVHLSTEKLVKESEDFEIVTSRGTMAIHLDDGNDAKIWKSMIKNLSSLTLRWVTQKITAFGSVSTDIKASKEARLYKKYDCFFSLAGNDNHTTYMMIAREDHKWVYGAGPGRIGRITRGRHIINLLREGDAISEIRPLVSEESTENVIVTKDMGYKLDDGYKVDSFVKIELNKKSPETSEHLLILSDKGYLNISDATGSYAACSDDVDVTIPLEDTQVRDMGSVSVRNDGVGVGRLFLYKERRQLSEAHSNAGKIISGFSIASLAKAGDKVTVETVPRRLITVGMKMGDAKKFLHDCNVKCNVSGDDNDDYVIVNQEPENTIKAYEAGEVTITGMPEDKVYQVSIDREKSPLSVHYFEKVTGLSHKSIGTLKVHFLFEDLPMITFVGDESRSHKLYPDDPFKECRRGDLGVTNQARPNAGIIGIRLKDDPVYGPTGEEGYGTNIFGRFESDLDKFQKGLEIDDIVYIKVVESKKKTVKKESKPKAEPKKAEKKTDAKEKPKKETKKAPAKKESKPKVPAKKAEKKPATKSKTKSKEKKA